MVEFTNIHFEGNYVYALETDMSTGIKCNIKLHLTKEEYATSENNLTSAMRSAIWNFQSDCQKLGKKLEGEKVVIAWG